MEENLIYVQNQERNLSFCSRFMDYLSVFDIFSFLPVPTARQISTKASIVGSISLILIFLSYVLTTFILFLTHNTPRTNQYFVPIQDFEIAKSPKFAIAFVTGQNLNESFYDEKYFNFTLEQVSIYKDVNREREYLPIQMKNCEKNNSEWMGSPNFTNIFCPHDFFSLEMQGLLYSSEVHRYPRIVISICDNKTRDNNCEKIDKIERYLQTGRIFLFFEKPMSKNFATGHTSEGGFKNFFYFLIPGFYNRVEISVRKNNFVIKPDYLTSFNEEKYTTYENTEEKYYNSKTANSSLIFLIWFRLDQNVQYTEVVYLTVIDQISLWGALWGVLFAVFALYFLKRNKNEFYKKKPEWNEFDQEIDKIKLKNLRKVSFGNSDRQEEEKVD